MTLSRNKLYGILIAACLAGYIWLYLSISNNTIVTTSCAVCLLKRFTSIPCPSCGSTRSVMSLSKGNFAEALWINPNGYLVAIIMIITPFWIMGDLISKKSTLFDSYRKIEPYLKKPEYAIPLILLVIINWIWNITKGL